MQKDFDKLLKLIEHQDNKIVIELLSHCKKTETTYSTFPKKSCLNNKLQLLSIYRTRWNIEKQRENNQFVYVYKELIPELSATKINDICISSITSEKGSYIIFTDNNKTEFIGILKSKRTLTEIREKYSAHKSLVEKAGEKLIYDYESNEIVFINGNLKKNI